LLRSLWRLECRRDDRSWPKDDVRRRVENPPPGFSTPSKSSPARWCRTRLDLHEAAGLCREARGAPRATESGRRRRPRLQRPSRAMANPA